MKVLVTGSAGHLGEALVRTLRANGIDAVGIDIVASPFTDHIGSIAQKDFVKGCFEGVTAVLHAATLHKPHVVTHSFQDFIDTNITGTLNLLSAAVEFGVASFVFTSTTSVFGDALIPPAGSPAAWIDESVVPIPKNIYGVTKAAAEDLCQLFHRKHGLPVVVLRTSRFFPEEDDQRRMRESYADDNLKVIEYLYRRVDLEDAVSAHLAAVEKAGRIGFGKYIISATTPFSVSDLGRLRTDAPAVVEELFPRYVQLFGSRGWKMIPQIDRIYVNTKARTELGWEPHYDFGRMLDRLSAGESIRSPMAVLVGSKGYHAEQFEDGPYPV